MHFDALLHLLATSGPSTIRVRTLEPRGVRRFVSGEFDSYCLPAGSLCTVIDLDDTGDTFLLVDEQGDEVWHVPPHAFDLVTLFPV